MRVDIIGGGISGLATAYFLLGRRPGLDLHVWERDDAPGGLAGCFSAERSQRADRQCEESPFRRGS